MKYNKIEKLNTEQGAENKIEDKELSLEKIPEEIKNVLEKLEEQGYEAYMVGGCVRDILRGEKPNDYDITTNAKPEEIQKVFPNSFYENKFGTVTAVNKTSDKSLKNVEITPFREEGKYTDKRHPDEIKFAETLEQDLERRDFTVNAMAVRIKDGKVEIIDLFNGKKDLENKIIGAVGNPEQRFQEDALRMIRAPRFVAKLGFDIEKKTKKAIQENAELLSAIAKERIGDEFLKIIESKNATAGIEMLQELKIFSKVLPEIEKEFAGKSFEKEDFPFLENGADTDFSLESRLALFFLDLKNIKDINEIELSKKTLKYLRVSNKIVKVVDALFRGNNLVNDAGKIDKCIARQLWRIFALKHRIDDDVKKTMEDFIIVKDIKSKKKIMSETSEDPLFLNDLKLHGGDIMKELKIKPGPKISEISNILLDKVLEDPQKNNREYLISEAKKLNE